MTRKRCRRPALASSLRALPPHSKSTAILFRDPIWSAVAEGLPRPGDTAFPLPADSAFCTAIQVSALYNLSKKRRRGLAGLKLQPSLSVWEGDRGLRTRSSKEGACRVTVENIVPICLLRGPSLAQRRRDAGVHLARRHSLTPDQALRDTPPRSATPIRKKHIHLPPTGCRRASSTQCWLECSHLRGNNASDLQATLPRLTEAHFG